MKFEQWDRNKLKSRLWKKGWVQRQNAYENISGQTHSWSAPGSNRQARCVTLRTAAKRERLIK